MKEKSMKVQTVMTCCNNRGSGSANFDRQYAQLTAQAAAQERRKVVTAQVVAAVQASRETLTRRHQP